MISIDSAGHGSALTPLEDLYSATVTAEVLPDLDSITTESLEIYRDLGYLAVSSVFADAQIADALDAMTALAVDPRGANIQFEAWAAERLDELSGKERLDYVRKFMKFADADERLRALAYDPRVLDVVKQIIGSDDIMLFQEMALLKPPGGGREKPWHQDNAFFRITPGTPIVGVWIALDEATIDNGCMHVLPGTHREGPVIHFMRRDWQICDTDVQTTRDVAVPLPPGGMLVFDGLLHHGTPSNNTEKRRRALQFHYIDAATEFTAEEDRLAIFGSEGKDAEC